MPLFAAQPEANRISAYRDAAALFSVNTLTQTIGVDRDPTYTPIQALEYQFLLDLAAAPDQATRDLFETEHTKARAMFSGLLQLWRKPRLEAAGWDTASIFAGLPYNEIYAYVLSDFIKVGFANIIIPLLFPAAVPFVYRAFYTNIYIDEPTIETHINAMGLKLAEKIVGFTGLDTGNPLSDYKNLFLNHEVPIPINGNTIIAPIRPGSQPDSYRLSMFFLDKELRDYSPQMSAFLTYFQRMASQFGEELRSLAGHPLIHKTTATNLPIESGRVDILDQTAFTGKADPQERAHIEMDWESHPAKLAVQNPPPYQLIPPASNDIDLTGHGVSFFRIFNPDGVNLRVEFDIDGGADLSGLSLNLGQPTGGSPTTTLSHDILGDTEIEMNVTCTQAKSPQSQININIYQLDDTLQNPVFVKQIDLAFFDFKMFPITFWNLHDTSFGLTYAGRDDLTTILNEINRVLGRQANTFVYCPNRDANDEPIDLELEIDDIASFIAPGSSLPDIPSYSLEVNRFAQALDQPGPADLNVIWSPRLPNVVSPKVNPGGYTTVLDTANFNFNHLTHPIIMIESYQSWHGLIPVNPGDNVPHGPELLSRVIVHECAHYFGYRFNTQDPDIDIHHEIPGVGEDEFYNNVLFKGGGKASPGPHLSTRQARLFNDNADSLN
jgi:hypothetical protein